MNQTLRQTETIRIAAPTEAQAYRHLLALGFALVFGGWAVWQLRQEWAKDQLWPWLLLLVVMFVSAQSLRRLELWLPGQPILPKLAGFRSWPMRLFGLFEIGIALLLVELVIWRLWPDFNKWQGTPIFWAAAILLFLFGA